MPEVKIACDVKDFLPISSLEEFQGELKSLTKANFARLRKQIETHGFVAPVFVWKSVDGNKIIDGHQRVRVVREMGKEGWTVPNLPVVFIEAKDERAARRILLGLVSQYGEVVDQGLYEFMGDIDLSMTELEENFQIPDIDLKKFDAEFFTEPIKEDEVPEPPKVAITKPGDLWEFGDHRLLCGDSCKDWPFDGKAEMMFTDPPYGVEYEGGHFHSGDVNIKRKRDDLKGDDVDVYGPFLKAIEKRIDGPCYVWFAGSRAWTIFSAVEEVGADVHAMIIWNKTNATYAAMNAQYKQRHEPCLYFKFSGSTLRWVGHSDECTVWDEKRDSRNDLHPTQKPVCLAARAIKNHEAKTVFDGFAGSGSTLIAAEQLNRRCYAIEIEPKYCDVIVERWENLTGGKATRKRV